METWGSVGSLVHCCRLRTPPRMAGRARRDFWELAKPVVGPFAGGGWVSEVSRCVGFRVLNRGCLIPFPANGQQKKFHGQFGAIIANATLG